MPNTMVRVLPSWKRWPFTSSQRGRSCGSGTSSGVTSQGPTGPKVSALLPFTHWPVPSSWKPRSETDRKSVVEGTSVSVRVDLGGRRIIKKKKKTKDNQHQNKTLPKYR